MQKQFFDSVADNWDKMCYHDPDKVSFLLNQISIQKTKRILDVGCGTGVLKDFLIKYEFSELTMIDFSQNMIKIAKQKSAQTPKINFICDDVMTHDFFEKKFDLVLCYSMFPHFLNAKKAIEKMYELLENNGKFAIMHSQSRNDINKLHKNKTNMQSDILPKAELLKNWFERVGFANVQSVDNKDVFLIYGQKLLNKNLV